jgi:ADP-ribose pyrophosphatase YjhB (NUDIX family)
VNPQIDPRNAYIEDELYKQILERMPIVCVDMLVLNDARDKYLLVKRDREPMKGEWWLPGGRLIRDESPIDAVTRIAEREVGLGVKLLNPLPQISSYRFPTSPYDSVGVHSVNLGFLVQAAPNAEHLTFIDHTSTSFKWDRLAYPARHLWPEHCRKAALQYVEHVQDTRWKTSFVFPFHVPELNVMMNRGIKIVLNERLFAKYKDLLKVLDQKVMFLPDPVEPSSIPVVQEAALPASLEPPPPPPSLNDDIRKRIAAKQPVVTFVWCVKNREQQLIDSINSIVSAEAAQYIHFEVVEDVSRQVSSLTALPQRRLFNHSIVSTGDLWNRSKLLNYGFKRARTPLVAAVDVDFIFPEDFLRTYLKMLQETDFDKTFLWISTTETENGVRRGVEYDQHSLYGGFYTYNRSHIDEIGGYDEAFQDYGHEERDFNWRLGVHTNTSPYRREMKHIVYHKSHDDCIRGVTGHTTDNFVRMKAHRQNATVVIDQQWGNCATVEVVNVADRDTLVVIGNGPSLKEVDLFSLSAYDTIAMNGMYRHSYRTGWWPTYFCCFDRVVTCCHSDDWQKMIEDDSVPIKQYFLMQKISESPKLKVLVPRGANHTFSMSFDSFANAGCTGANAVQIGMCLGYKKFILLGIDATYVQLVEGARTTGVHARPNELVMDITPAKNPNYFIDDYQQAGDKFNVPNEHIFHVPAWKSLAHYICTQGLTVINCSMQSALDCFPKKPLREVLNG